MSIVFLLTSFGRPLSSNNKSSVKTSFERSIYPMIGNELLKMLPIKNRFSRLISEQNTIIGLAQFSWLVCFDVDLLSA